ncbi:MAG TPA: hypothetical protein VGW38_04675 [Chloroflexota bacterium]|nr:hypothetical protein [Chloroflexota bacterium]
MALVRWWAGVLLLVIAAAAAVTVVAFSGSFWSIAVAFAGASAACLAGDWMQARHAIGGSRRRHCLDCGASVPDQLTVCPRCRSVRIEVPAIAGAVHVPGGSRELPVAAYSGDASGVIGWVDASPPGGAEAGDLIGSHMLRLWSGVLLGIAGFFAMLGIAGALGSWSVALLVFAVVVAASVTIARSQSLRAIRG